ncbi:hypothetical protein [Paraflavitalea pollutisoli]|uniref:hypothetical protein n=1 Tax=Paraflavitalea pollutisoli TaxID=3034143 RepID=UPI0023EC956D|nr:hypothetical protein [Paraflavitalea sp. H1-2-19X]
MKKLLLNKDRRFFCGIGLTALGKNIVVISAITVSLVACRKDRQDPPPPTGEINLEVAFGTGAVDYSLIDSGFVVLKKAGATNQFFKRFSKKDKLLWFSLEDLTAGNWTAEMYLFSRFDATGGRRYQQEKAFTLPAGGLKESISLTAPTGAITDSWKPYAFFRQEEQGVSVAVALDNTNPHFDVQVRDNTWNFFYIERYASNRLEGGANAKVAEMIWECRDGCYTADKYINNKTAFLPFVQEVGSKFWNNGLIIVVIGVNGGPAVQFSHKYNK